MEQGGDGVKLAPTCQQQLGAVGLQLQGLVGVEVEAVDGVVLDPPVGLRRRAPADQQRGGVDDLMGHVQHGAGH